MTKKDIAFTPHSDMDIHDMAAAKKGFCAAIFNTIQNKLREIQLYLLNKTAEPDAYYSFTEPTEEEMQGKTFWLQPVEDNTKEREDT